MSRVAHGEHLSKGFAQELVVASFAGGMDVRLLDPGMTITTPECPSWLVVCLDWFTDSEGPESFDQSTITGLIHAAKRAAIVACAPVPAVNSYIVQSGLAPGGCFCVLTHPTRIFAWMGIVRAAGDFTPHTVILRKPPRP